MVGGVMLKKFSLFVLIAVIAPAFAQESQPSFDGKTWWEHIKVLAADNMEGRDTGSLGLKRAEAYVVGQLKTSGIQPAGVKGYYQSVKFESRQLMEKESSALLVRDGLAAVAEWEAEQGAFTESELVAARERVAAQLRSSAPRSHRRPA